MKTANQQTPTIPRQGQMINLVPYVAGVLILVILPVFLSSYSQSVMTRFLIFALFATGYNLAFGYAGLISLGHAAYFGAGGYTVAVLKLHYGSDLFWICTPLGILIATIIAAIFGIIALRVSGIYFLLVTFALGQLLYSVAWNVSWLNTPGMQGVSGLSLPTFGIAGFTLNTTSFYYLVLLVSLICFYLLFRIVNSPFGHALVGIREGEDRMRSLGYNTWLYKYLAFVISGAFSGIAGVLFGYYNYLISPTHLGVGTSFLPMCMAIIGGVGTLLGPVIGAAVIIFVELYASIMTPERWPLILGGLFVVAIMFAREGIGVYLWRLCNKVGHYYGSTKS
ncbi:MAG: branched-chain amino acid ABC transporter permease [Deltaproteobacteria bacterium]|nr:MAG: branched-chain amino acid ABC transporter permease [Deltaproteobacteria bacterium]